MQTKILEIKSDSPEETELAGAKTAATAKRMGVDFIAMFGDLGAGKTAFTRGAASVLAPGARVTSPTYAIVNEYLPNVQNEFTMPVFHFDMYRIVSDDDLDSIDFDGYLGRGMILTEWSENIADRLPKRYFSVIITKIGRIREIFRCITRKDEMLVLALDTTAKTASCAVLEKDADGERMRAVSTVCGTLTHSETMLPMIEKMLGNIGKKTADLDLFAVSAGPGCCLRACASARRWSRGSPSGPGSRASASRHLKRSRRICGS